MRYLPILSLVLGLAACSSTSTAPLADDSLYRALGGQPGITRIVQGLLLNIADNPQIVAHFADTDIDRLNAKLIEQFCVESGGPCAYSGDSMRDSHAGLNLTEADFNALVEALLDAMRALNVPVPAQNRLLARLAPMRSDIIYR